MARETLIQEKIMTESAVVNGYIREAVEQTKLRLRIRNEITVTFGRLVRSLPGNHENPGQSRQDSPL